MSEIESLTKFSHNTVKKYIDKEDFNLENPTTKPEKSPRPSILDPFKPIIDKYIQGDLIDGTHKQKHNAQRVFERLSKEEGYKGGYRTVNDYFQDRRKELGMPNKKAFIPLEHSPGEAQGDFGECENFIEDNNLIPGFHFSLSFPYSNASFIQIKYGQNTECLLESMKAIFEYIGGVPKEIWLDNASTMVATLGRSVDDRKMTPRLQAFSMHYNFNVKFANPHSGHEKGSVEVSNRFQREHTLTPPPRFINIGVFNKELLEQNTKQLERLHYRKGKAISELFEEDKKALLPLPSIPFDTARYEQIMADACGLITLDSDYIYSSSDKVANTLVTLKITSSTVTVLDSKNQEVVVHRRLYGNKGKKLESINYIPYLDQIAIKPRAWMNTALARLVPERLERYIENCRNSDRGKLIKIISKITKEKGFDIAVEVVMEAVNLDTYDPEGLDKVYRRIYLGESTPAEETSRDDDKFEKDVLASIFQYDSLLKEEDEAPTDDTEE